MRISETVTFGGGGLDRAGHLRGDPAAISRLSTQKNAKAIALWRGKVLVTGGDAPTVARLPVGHKVFDVADILTAFMGMVNGAPAFAHDISGVELSDVPNPGVGFFDTSEVAHPLLPADHRFVDLRQVMAQLTPLDAELAASAKALFNWHGAHGFCAKCGQASQVSTAGWQRVCPACQTSHFPRTDPVVIMLITQGNNVLLGRSPQWPERMYSLLAGFIEPGETLESAVRREVFEEVGIKVGEVGYLASQPWPFPASLMVGCRGIALSSKITADPAEIEDAMWISREDLMDVFAGRNADIMPARRGSIAHFLLENWLADRLV